LGKPLGPVRIELHPTNRCNLRCRFCWQTISKPEDVKYEIPDERLIELVGEAAELGVKEWIISGGGEPFMRPEVSLKIMKLIKAQGMWGQLTTNGVLLKKSDVKTLVDIGWDQIQFSVDSPDAKTHDFLRRGKNAFKQAIGNAKLLAQYRSKKGSNKPYLGFNTCITAKNYDKLCDMIRLGKEVGFDLVFFEPVYVGYVSKIRLELNDKEKQVLEKAAKKAKKLAEKLGIATNADRFMRTELVDKQDFGNVVIRETETSDDTYISAPCYQPWYLMGIKGCGMAGCCSTFEQGEYLQDKSLKEIWFGKLFNNIREDVLSHQLPEYCKKCSVVVVMDNKEIRKSLKTEILKHKISPRRIIKRMVHTK